MLNDGYTSTSSLIVGDVGCAFRQRYVTSEAVVASLDAAGRRKSSSGKVPWIRDWTAQIAHYEAPEWSRGATPCGRFRSRKSRLIGRDREG